MLAPTGSAMRRSPCRAAVPTGLAAAAAMGEYHGRTELAPPVDKIAGG